MADIVTNTLEVGGNNLILRDADAQAKLATNTQDISTLKEDSSLLDDRVTALEEGGGSGSGLTEDIKAALLQIARKVAYVDEHGQDYYDDLYDALYAVTAIRLDANSIMLTSIGSTQQLTATTTPPGGAVTWASSDTSIATVSNTGLVTSVGYGSCTITASAGSVSASCAVAVSQVALTSIAADYQQSGTVYETASLDSLKGDLTVTATYSDSSTATVTEYTLSGTLTAGTSTITVSYGGKTTTFTVTVTAAPTLTSISAVYTQSGIVYDTDTLDSLKDDLVVTATYSDSSTQTVTEYTLSGTLAKGTSTVTVTYSGKTTTFTVTVTSEYTWMYRSVDGVLLSAETDLVSDTLTKGSPTETIQDGLLHIVAQGDSGAYVQYNLIPNTNTNAVLEAKVRCNSLPRFVNLACGLIVMVSNGTAGARLSVDSNGFKYSEGTAYTNVNFPTGFDYTDWHRYKVELTSDGKQIGYVDGVKIFETATLSSQYATVTRIGLIKNASVSTVDVDIEWIAFLDRSAI